MVGDPMLREYFNIIIRVFRGRVIGFLILKNSMKPDQIEGFEHEKADQMPPEYPGYDSRT
jgi:hypothetical protein